MSQSTISDIVSGSFVLAEVVLRSKSFTKKDNRATEQTIANNHASADAGKFEKNLFASASQELKALQKAGAACRTYLYAHTTPYDTGSGSLRRGPRLLPTTQSMDFMQGFNELEMAYNTALGDFKQVYDQRKAQALAALGGMANPNDYPDASELDDYFGVELVITPVPASGQLPNALPTEVLEAAAESMTQAQISSMDVALADTRRRLGEELERMVSVMRKHSEGEKTKLYASLLDNMRTVTDLLEATNITGDQTLAEVVKQVREELVPPARTIDDYKISRELAGSAADAAAAISTKLTGAPSFAPPNATVAPLSQAMASMPDVEVTNLTLSDKEPADISGLPVAIGEEPAEEMKQYLEIADQLPDMDDMF